MILWLSALSATVVLLVLRIIAQRWLENQRDILRIADRLDTCDATGMSRTRQEFRSRLGEKGYAAFERRVATLRRAEARVKARHG